MKIKHYFLTALFPIMFWTGSFAQWITQTSGTTQSISSIYATGTANVFAVGNNGIARKTINSGNTWQTMNSSSTNAQNSIRFINSTTGFTAGAWQDILQTTDSGNSWSNIGGGMTDLYDCYFISSTSGWVGGDIEAGYGFLYNPSTMQIMVLRLAIAAQF